MVFGEHLLLLSGPLLVFNGVVEVVMISLSALLAVSALDVKVSFHDACYFRPALDVFVFVEVFEDAILLHRLTGTT